MQRVGQVSFSDMLMCVQGTSRRRLREDGAALHNCADREKEIAQQLDGFTAEIRPLLHCNFYRTDVSSMPWPLSILPNRQFAFKRTIFRKNSPALTLVASWSIRWVAVWSAHRRNVRQVVTQLAQSWPWLVRRVPAPPDAIFTVPRQTWGEKLIVVH